MKLETLQDRKSKAEERIIKKSNTIGKKESSIIKKEEQLTNLTDEHDIYWMKCEIESLKADVTRLKKEINELGNKVQEYEKQIDGEVEKEKLFETEIPDTMKDLQKNLEEQWNEYDIEKRDAYHNYIIQSGYSKFIEHHTASEYDFAYKSDEQIKKANAQDAKMCVLDLYNRVKHITGDVTSWDGIHLEKGNMGCVLNGTVIGKLGRATVESIVAGGYNIQKLHIRVLVKEC